jgi:putative transposase
MAKNGFKFTPGSKVCWNGDPFWVYALKGRKVVLRSMETYKKRTVSIDGITRLKEPPVVKEEAKSNSHKDVTKFSKAQMQTAKEIAKHLEPILAGKVTEAKVARVAKEISKAVKPVSVKTVYRWRRKFIKGQRRVTALIPRTSSGGSGESRLTEEQEALLRDTVEDFYLIKGQPPIYESYDYLMGLCEERNKWATTMITPPSRDTLRRRIADIGKWRKKKRRESDNAANQLEPIRGKFPHNEYPYRCLQIDHTKMDIDLVDEEYRQPCGRPWITVAIDTYSRMVAGFYLSFDPPGDVSAGQCIAMAMLKKDSFLARVRAKYQWICYGVPEIIHADNAKEFKGKMLKTACDIYHPCEMRFRPVKKPRYGAYIERLMGTFARKLKRLPGATFSNPKERGERHPDGKMTISEYERWLTDYITGVYHRDNHSTLGMSPEQKYLQGIKGTPGQPGIGEQEPLEDELRVRLDFMPFKRRSVQREGIEIDGIFYYDSILRDFIGEENPDDPEGEGKYLSRRDPRHIKSIFFYHPKDEEYYEIPYRDITHPDMSIWELRKIKEYLNSMNIPETEASIFEAKRHLDQIVAESMKTTRATRKAQAQKAHHQSPAGQLPKRPAKSTTTLPSLPAPSPTRVFKPAKYIEE